MLTWARLADDTMPTALGTRYSSPVLGMEIALDFARMGHEIARSAAGHERSTPNSINCFSYCKMQGPSKPAGTRAQRRGSGRGEFPPQTRCIQPQRSYQKRHEHHDLLMHGVNTKGGGGDDASHSLQSRPLGASVARDWPPPSARRSGSFELLGLCSVPTPN